ncbi:MAG: PHP domain-containing protein [Fimbriimonadaceae bacterium]|nr:PHP domain-containing protein [Fimbriimonadaceae bacterium]
MDAPSFDTHLHTVYCGHAAEDMLVPNLLRAAAARGLRAVAITEHLHVPQHRARVDRIQTDLRRVADQVPCDVYVGAEIDADGLAEDGSLVAHTDGLAYVIASTHHFPGGKDWWYDNPVLGPDQRAAVVERWFAWATKLVSNPVVDTLAHPGIFLSRNGLTPAFAGAVLDGFRGVFAAAAAHNTLIELNELAVKKLTPRHRDTYPDLMQAALDAGCRLVMASDAHSPRDVGAFGWTLEVAAALGLQAADFAEPAWRQPPAARRPA